MICTEEAIQAIKDYQAATPPHLAGLPHNVDCASTAAVTAYVAATSGIPVVPGDIWVNVVEAPGLRLDAGTGRFEPFDGGSVSFGYATRDGAVAMHRIQDMLEVGELLPEFDSKTLTIVGNRPE